MKGLLTKVSATVATILMLQGCVAAALPLLAAASFASVAIGGFSIFKSVQMTTGGSANIQFSDVVLSAEDKQHLAAFTSPTVWPENEGEAYLASRLESSASFSSVITPSTAARALEDLDIDRNTNLLTEAERRKIFGEVCDHVGADAMIAVRDLGSETTANAWSFKRASQTFRGLVTVYSRKADRVILTTEVVLQVDLGSDFPNEQELMKVTGEAIAEKLIELRAS
jgi:hypothetical protein